MTARRSLAVATAGFAVLATLAGAACGPVRAPVAPGAKLAAPPGIAEGTRQIEATVLVAPVIGLPGDVAAAAAARIALALRERGVGAATRNPAPGSHLLASRVDGGELEVRLVEASGLHAGTVRVPLPAADDSDPQAWYVALGERVAAAMAGGATPPAANAAPVAPVCVAGVTGAPGDGDRALAAALAVQLALAGVPVRRQDEGACTRVNGHVTMGPPTDGQQSVALDWTVTAPDGRELGRVRQDNVVDAGSLDLRWGEVARLAAMGGAEGVVPMLRSAR